MKKSNSPPAWLLGRARADLAELALQANPAPAAIPVREAVEGLIEALGFRVNAFRSAIDFLASTAVADTSCMIADVQMPQMSGVELHRRLTEQGPAIPTILITAYPDDGIRACALDRGVICYLIKPFDEDALIACVRSALRSAKPGAGT